MKKATKRISINGTRYTVKSVCGTKVCIKTMQGYRWIDNPRVAAPRVSESVLIQRGE